MIGDIASLELPRDLMNTMLEHARSAHPLECCGALLGTFEQHVVRAVRAVALENDAAEQRVQYSIAARSLIALEQNAERARLDVVAFYHSHPSGVAVPSTTDRAQAVPWYTYIILGLAAEPAQRVRAYAFEDGRVRELSIFDLRDDVAVISVRLPAALRELAAGRAEIDVEGDTVAQAIAALLQIHPPLTRHLFAQQGTLRSYVNVFVNQSDVRDLDGLQTRLHPGDVIQIVPSIAGGGRNTGTADLRSGTRYTGSQTRSPQPNALAT